MILTSVLTLILLGPKQEFQISPLSITRLEGELTAQQAHQVMRSKLLDLNIAWPQGDTQLELERGVRQRLWTLNSSSLVLVSIDSVSGELQRFEKGKVLSEKSNVPYEGLYRTEIQIRQRFEEIADQVLGKVEHEAKLLEIGDKAKDGLYYANVYGTFRILHRGTPVQFVQFECAFDLRNGEITHINSNIDFKVRDEDPLLSLEACVGIATSAYNSNLRGREPNEYSRGAPGSLCFAAVTPSLPREVTISYSVPFGPDKVFVDAVTGKVLKISFAPRL